MLANIHRQMPTPCVAFLQQLRHSFLNYFSAHLARDTAYTPGEMLAAQRLHDTTASITAKAGLQAAACWLDRCATTACKSRTSIKQNGLASCPG